MFTLNFSHYIYPEQQKITATKKNSQIDLRIYAIKIFYLLSSRIKRWILLIFLFRFAGRDLTPSDIIIPISFNAMQAMQ